jgi:hypothetical protein
VRLWSLHPRYLDRQGLTAAWREGLLAQAVLLGRTRGYRSHPQLARFQAMRASRGLIAAYLHAVCAEAARRSYRFDRSRIVGRPSSTRLTVTRDQLAFEWKHLRAKLRRRSPDVYLRWRGVALPTPHPLFRVVPGAVADWERV